MSKYTHAVVYDHWFIDRNGDWDFREERDYYTSQELAERAMPLVLARPFARNNHIKVITLPYPIENWECSKYPND